jgi:hypothetical protein
VRDLGRGGIGVLYRRRLLANALFAISLPASDEGGVTAVYRVEHCDPLEGGLFRIGGSMVRLSEEGDVEVPPQAVEPEPAAKSKTRKPAR